VVCYLFCVLYLSFICCYFSPAILWRRVRCSRWRVEKSRRTKNIITSRRSDASALVTKGRFKFWTKAAETARWDSLNVSKWNVTRALFVFSKNSHNNSTVIISATVFALVVRPRWFREVLNLKRVLRRYNYEGSSANKTSFKEQMPVTCSENEIVLNSLLDSLLFRVVGGRVETTGENCRKKVGVYRSSEIDWNILYWNMYISDVFFLKSNMSFLKRTSVDYDLTFKMKTTRKIQVL